jgi:NADH:ubiquinone reductase (H+-translocating)
MMAKGRIWLAAGALALGAGLAASLAVRFSGTHLGPVHMGGSRRNREPSTERGEEPQGPRVVILGAGFAGLTVARALQRRLAGQARVTLIDRHNYHLFTPMLYQVATWGLDPYDTAYPLRQFVGRAGVSFRKALVTGVDLDRRRVQLGSDGVDYDYLVIALGSTTNFFGNQDAASHALPLKWLEDGVAIRNQVIDMLEQAAETHDADERRALLTFVIVGGGATGVEAAASLADLLHEVIPADYPGIGPEEARVVVIEAEGKLLGHMGESMATSALAHLRSVGVEVRLNTKAQDVTENQVSTSDGRKLATHTILWSTGVRAPQVVSGLDVAHGKGGSLAVDEYLRLRGHPEVFVCGDCCHYEDPATQQAVPLLAQAAVDEGRAVAANLASAIAGAPLRTFHYRSLGEAVSLGRGAGAVRIGANGPVLDGLAGWLGWRVVHLARITSFRNRLATVLDWSVGYLYDLNTTRLELEPVPASARAEPG